MQPFSYNETKSRKTELQHIFLPGPYGLVSEAVIGVLALLFFNLSELSNHLITQNFNGEDSLPLWNQVIKNTLATVQDYSIVQQALLFMLWAIAGALLYIMVFRILQLILGAKSEVSSGVRYIKRYHSWGLFYWFISLHDFFLKVLIIIVGGAAIIIGAFVCFGIASHELSNGLASNFPDNVLPLVLSFLGAVLSIRLIVLGISLLSSRFRNWYAT